MNKLMHFQKYKTAVPTCIPTRINLLTIENTLHNNSLRKQAAFLSPNYSQNKLTNITLEYTYNTCSYSGSIIVSTY